MPDLAEILYWDGETVPFQKSTSTEVPKPIAVEAHKEYSEHFDQSFEQLHNRGGFGAVEMMKLLYNRIKRLEDDD